MSSKTDFSTRVYHIKRADGRQRFVATDRPYTIDLGPEGAPLPRVELLDTSTLTPRERAYLRAAIEFDAQTFRRDKRDEYVSWVIAPDARLACIREAAQVELDLLEWAIVDCTEFFTDDDEPTLCQPKSETRRITTMAWGSP